MDGEKRQTFGHEVVRRIRSFVFGKRKETHSTNNPFIYCGNIKLLRLTNTKTKSTNPNQKEVHQQKKAEEQQQQQESNEKEGKKEGKIPFSLFVKCVKNSLSTKQSRQQLFRQSYTYFWDFLFGDAAAKVRMAEEEYYNEFYADFDDEEFY
ncbi:Hypothetical predicted protein [Mytilus galloprovincialis]|uniref:Uncharacterized protein n=1 Tax=Mytilus galloprovincialis TaxID=29158 RepID=A0A8B6E127_MYTGA|nr:Hypothetical predicted protein [Mytilus galloprovincialis]